MAGHIGLMAAARRARVLVFFGFLAWMFGINPPGWQRLLLAFLALAAVAADIYLDGHLNTRTKPRYETAA
ncbi:hypothetical protein OG592_27125 [Streptomyces avidinii]|uniref:hypothetical protein n=1 Tax=Streptomyces avidinii TaxID=1895 RepID=UPI00386B707B|nr:hypothetical protein OG592_27125 [Streptomyces avidinii]